MNVPNVRPVEILLVEDNPGDVQLCREAFRSAKIANRLRVAESGEEALAVLRGQGRHQDEQPPDVILLDLNLPDRNGQEILEELKSDDGLSGIPVVILSASQAHRDIMDSYGLLASGYIVKPVDFDKLRTAVDSIDRFRFAVVTEDAPPGAGL